MYPHLYAFLITARRQRSSLLIVAGETNVPFRSPRPCRRLDTLMRPSHPVRHFWPRRNQRFFCSRRFAALLVARLGMQTRLTPFALAARSLQPRAPVCES